MATDLIRSINEKTIQEDPDKYTGGRDSLSSKSTRLTFNSARRITEAFMKNTQITADEMHWHDSLKTQDRKAVQRRPVPSFFSVPTSSMDSASKKSSLKLSKKSSRQSSHKSFMGKAGQFSSRDAQGTPQTFSNMKSRSKTSQGSSRTGKTRHGTQSEYTKPSSGKPFSISSASKPVSHSNTSKPFSSLGGSTATQVLSRFPGGFSSTHSRG